METMREAPFLGHKIMLFTAHPDDESYLAAGTIYENRRHGGRTDLVCATCGGKGSSHLRQPLRAKALKLLRQGELRRAAKYLGAGTVVIYDFPDGKLSTRETPLFEKALRIAQKLKPEYILSFGLDGITGHLDHIAAGRVARKIAAWLSIPFYAFALPPKFGKNAQKWLVSRRKKGSYAKGKLQFGKPDTAVKIRRQVKLRALRFHASQMEGKNLFTGYPDYAVRALLSHEYFVRMKV